jgi:hypothetical protein
MPLLGGLTAEAKAVDDQVKEICEKVCCSPILCSCSLPSLLPFFSP